HSVSKVHRHPAGRRDPKRHARRPGQSAHRRDPGRHVQGLVPRSRSGRVDGGGNAAMSRDEERLVRETYERVPYPSGAQHHTHPDHVAALAILTGLDPAPPQRARVLELGCADGSNLIPMAAELADSRFVGIDLSPRQIENGRAMAGEMALENLELRAMSILDADVSLGQFDYIICHGVFSWVTTDVQEKILEICRANLAPNGVAYVSYNTYPGWRLREAARDMVVFHTRHCTDLEER